MVHEVDSSINIEYDLLLGLWRPLLDRWLLAIVEIKVYYGVISDELTQLRTR